MKKFLVPLLLVVLCLPIFSKKNQHFKRVETFPKGAQTNSIVGSFLSGVKDYKIVKYTFDAPYERVWPAVKCVAQTFVNISGRQLVVVDEVNNIIQIGQITQNQIIGLGSGAMLDQFILKADKLDTKTEVIVKRKIVRREATGQRAWKTVLSNGKIERYIMTQIEDEIKNPTNVDKKTGEGFQEINANSNSIDNSKFPSEKYINKKNETEYFELKPDKTFYLRERGMSISGKYEISGNVLTFILPGGMTAQATMNEGIIHDKDGKNWIKAGGAYSNAVHSEIFTNNDIIRLIEAKLPDSIIIEKINSSKCKFDTYTDAIINLKQSGVSDEIIQIIIRKVCK